MVKKHLYGSMTWEEVNDAVREGRVTLLPIGQIEQHGPHLPIDADVVQANYVCEEAARRAPELLVSAPSVNYGFSEHLMDFPGTITVRPEVLTDYYYDVCRSFVRQGFQRIILVSGHAFNQPMLEIAADRIAAHNNALCAITSPYALAKHVMAEIREGGEGAIYHAGEIETSDYMYLLPDLVKLDKIQDDYGPDYLPWRTRGFLEEQGSVYFTEHWSQRSSMGVAGAPSLASPEKGRIILEAAIANLLKFGKWFKELEMRPRTDHTVKGG